MAYTSSDEICAGTDGSAGGWFPFKDSSGAHWAVNFPVSASRTDVSAFTLVGCRSTDVFSSTTGCNAPASNSEPNAEAGVDQSVEENTIVSLSATASTDPDGDTLSYTWAQVSGTSVTLSSASSSVASFTAPFVDGSDTLEFRLTVTDPSGLSDVDTVIVTVTDSGAETSHIASAKVGSTLVSDVMVRASDHVASSRLERRFRNRSSGAFTALKTSAPANWTAFESDQLLDSFAVHDRQKSMEALGLDEQTAGMLSDVFGDPLNTEIGNWDFYTATGFGSMNGTGTLGFEGNAQYWTAGFDYMPTDDFVFGANLSFEQSDIDFDKAVDGEINKKGFRGDGYFGYQFPGGLVVEAIGSYAQLENEITANFDTGKTDSERYMAVVKVAGRGDYLGVDVQPFVSASYVYEDFDRYLTAMGMQVEGFSTEMSRGIAGAELLAPDAAIFGLQPFLGVQAEWDWLNEGSVRLASGTSFEADDFGLTYNFGVRGRLEGTSEFGYVGELLNGATFNIDYSNTAFGRDQETELLQWSLSVPF